MEPFETNLNAHEPEQHLSDVLFLIQLYVDGWINTSVHKWQENILFDFKSLSVSWYKLD